MAIAKTNNKTAVNLVENRIFLMDWNIKLLRAKITIFTELKGIKKFIWEV